MCPDISCEAQVLQIEDNAPAVAAARALLLLVVLYSKWRGIQYDPGLVYLAQHAEGQWWAGSVLSLCDSWLSEQATWTDALRVLVNSVITQHDKVMYEKGRLDSCWVHCNDGRLIKDQDYRPSWRSSRHDSAVRILCDLDLLQHLDSGGLLLTAVGRRLLRTLLKRIE